MGVDKTSRKTGKAYTASLVAGVLSGTTSRFGHRGRIALGIWTEMKYGRQKKTSISQRLCLSTILPPKFANPHRFVFGVGVCTL